MPAAYSIDLRERIVNAYESNQGSQRQIAQRFQVSLSFVKSLLRRYRITGQIKAKPHGGGAKLVIKESQLGQIQQLVDEQPDALLRELCERGEEIEGTKVSISTMHRKLQQLKLTTKKTLYANEQETLRVKKMRFEYRNWVLGIAPHKLIFIDESGINLGMTRLRGRSIRGERLHDSCPRNRGSNISVIGALSMDGLIATMSLPGSVNTEVFSTYIEKVLAPQLWVGAYVVMDNLSVHKADATPRRRKAQGNAHQAASRIRQIINQAGAELIFLPPTCG